MSRLGTNQPNVRRAIPGSETKLLPAQLETDTGICFPLDLVEDACRPPYEEVPVVLPAPPVGRSSEINYSKPAIFLAWTYLLFVE